MSTGAPVLGQRVYLDSNLYIYVFEGVETYRTRMVELLSVIDSRDIVVIASELLFTEILPRPVKEGRQDLAERYLDLVRNTPRIHLVSVDRPVILRSVHLRAEFGLRSMDALHLATALVHGCETFITNDRRLARIDLIRVFTLDDLRGMAASAPE